MNIELMGNTIDLRNVTTDNGHIALWDYTNFCCGVTLPLAGLHYPELRDYTTLNHPILFGFPLKNKISCGITLPYININPFSISFLTFKQDSRRYRRLRDYTTFCGITLPLAGLHYPIFWDYTTLGAGLHYLFLRDYTTPKIIKVSSQHVDIKYNTNHFAETIKLPYKTLFNYIIKQIRTSLPFSNKIMFAYANESICT